MILGKIYKKILSNRDRRFLASKLLKIFFAELVILWLAILMTLGGNGTYIQFPIFYSWLSLPFFMSFSHENILWAIYSISFPLIFFFITIFLIISIWKSENSKSLLQKALFAHFAGSIFCIIFAEYYGSPLSQNILIKISGVFASSITSYYFWLMFFCISDYKAGLVRVEHYEHDHFSIFNLLFRFFRIKLRHAIHVPHFIHRR